MVKRLSLMLLFCAILAACSSGGSSEDSVCTQNCGGVTPAVEVVPKTTRTLATSGGLAGGVTGANYDPITGVFTITAPGLNATMGRFATADFGGFFAMRDLAGIHNAYFGQGQGTEIVIYSGGTAGNVQSLASYGRTGPTELPLSGDATFNGEYAGFTSTRRINGKARLDVSFARGTFSGRITDRVFRQRPDNVADVVNPLSMLILEETSLNADGSFQGVTGGGQIVNGQVLWNPANGSYVGLIGGATCSEAVRTVNVPHRAPSGGSFDEIGGFLATR